PSQAAVRERVVDHERPTLDAEGHRSRGDRRARDDLDVFAGDERILRGLADELLAEALGAHLVAVGLAVLHDLDERNRALAREAHRKIDGLMHAELAVEEREAVGALSARLGEVHGPALLDGALTELPADLDRFRVRERDRLEPDVLCPVEEAREH